MWAIVHQSTILYRGSYGACARAAESYGLTPRIVTTASDLHPGLTRQPLILPVALLPERYRRRAA